eukprot:3243734-Heterocapsa_arctica.AAC.1
MAALDLLLPEPSQFASMHLVLRTDPDLRDRGLQSEEKGKAEKKVDYPPYQGRGDYPPPSVQKDRANNGKASGEESNKLGQMRTMLKAAEAIPGWEDKVEELRLKIKEQLKLSNQEQS